MEPTQGPLSGMVEFHGRVNSNNSLTSDFYVQFDENVVENFDPNQYNEAINFIHTIPNPWVCDDKERSMDM
ncbi:hypothetical protein C0J52_16499 [Blattella germanica]|nr:hypothetical protein C0J52_16499 [Blattella germanica]